MKERPILFSGEMVRAILDGTKTQTRRVVKPQPAEVRDATAHVAAFIDRVPFLDRGRVVGTEDKVRLCPYGAPGGKLWVRETWYCDHGLYPSAPVEEMRELLEYRATHDCGSWEAGCPCRDDEGRGSWRPSIHMPRWASRIDLELTSVRVERVQEISEEDALAEGVGPIGPSGIRWPNFARLWDEINGKRPGCSWADNPWVWVVSFRRLR